MPFLKPMLATATIALVTAPAPALAQDVEGDANSNLVQLGRYHSPDGTFWLDSNDDTELIRYTSARDVSLCLPKPGGVDTADKGYPLRITWDNQWSTVLRPGNCFYFDAKTVKVRPAEPLPNNVTLEGRVRTESALQRGN